jgi:hypothetical protein
MTIRQVGELAIKILGIYYASLAVLGVGGVLSSLALPRMEGVSAGELVVLNVVGVVGLAFVAAACLLRAQMLAGWLFTEEPVPLSGVTRHDGLFVGISLIGLVWVVSGVPDIVKVLGRGVWYAEGSRQPMLAEVMRQSSEALVEAVLSILVGGALVISARRLAMRLDARS